MKLEQQVTSLELSKKLKELGINKESFYYHREYETENGTITDITFYKNLTDNSINHPAFILAELLELLPYSLIKYALNEDVLLLHVNKSSCYYGKSSKTALIIFFTDSDNNLCNCLAKMLIHLMENNLLENK